MPNNLKTKLAAQEVEKTLSKLFSYGSWYEAWMRGVHTDSVHEFLDTFGDDMDAAGSTTASWLADYMHSIRRSVNDDHVTCHMSISYAAPDRRHVVRQPSRHLVARSIQGPRGTCPRTREPSPCALRASRPRTRC